MTLPDWARVSISPAEAKELLAIIGRDPQPATAPDRCSDCGRSARELQPWHETVGGQRMVVARLGPSCWRKRMDAGAGRQALPIGGESDGR
ncbi:hypothetical protein [Actinoplanes ianthinogenes]|nr:hypothetical protein [Actinoplanes ianthinogenes]